ncbi:transcription antiterminator [Streptococcus sp. H49]|uniref:BglG family transcription antiterminator n=1 Tax=Streptococcus huangxiaojuni TaxID=3237239 RepID=UPI0034A164AE
MANKNKTIDNLLLLLSGSVRFVTAKELAESLTLSEKTIYRLVKEVNKNYPDKPLILPEKGKGFILNHDVYLRDYQEVRQSDEELSPSERQTKILERLLLMSPKGYLIYDLCQEYFVSEAVIAKDRKEIQQQLRPYHLQLFGRRRALSIQGKEFDVRRAIADLIPAFSTIDLDHLEQLKDDNQLNYELAVFVKSEIEKIEKTLDVIIPYPYNINIFSHLYILLERIKKGAKSRLPLGSDSVFAVKEKDSILKISQEIISDITAYTGVSITKEEVLYLFSYLMSSRLQNETDHSPPDFSQRVLAVTHFYLTEMTVTADYQLTENSRIFIDLANHISPLLRRLDNKIRVKNKMLGQIRMSYPKMFKEVEQVSELVSSHYNFPQISPDEIGFLTLYFARFVEEASKPIKTLVMCSSGIGTSDLLRAKLEKQFAELEILNVIGYRQLDSLKETYPDAELLISTIALGKDLSLPNVLVSALLIEDDKKRIQKKVEEIRHG